MTRKIVKVVAKNYKLDSDEVLIMLWDYGEQFDYLDNENSTIKKRDFKIVKKIISQTKKNEERVIKKQDQKNKKIFKNYDFSKIGKKQEDIIYLTKEEVMMIYNKLVDDFSKKEDPISPCGLRNEGMLESAIFHQKTSFFGKNKYPTIESTSAALMYSISANHPFYNGNKRTAMVSMMVLLDRHNLTLTCEENSLFKISIKLASHNLVQDKESYTPDAEIFELANWIKNNNKLITKEERVLTRKKLERILKEFDCEILDNGYIQRKIRRKIFGSKKLLSKVKIDKTIAGGDEINKTLIKQIREELELTFEHGIDSDVFYEKVKNTPVDDFIITYQTLLKRLSKA